VSIRSNASAAVGSHFRTLTTELKGMSWEIFITSPSSFPCATSITSRSVLFSISFITLTSVGFLRVTIFALVNVISSLGSRERSNGNME
jgi:hypothetical protein